MIIAVAMDSTETTMVISSYQGSASFNRKYSVGANFTLTSLGIISAYCISLPPIKVILHNGFLYTCHQVSPTRVFVTNLTSNNYVSLSMNFSSYNMTHTPDNKKVIFFDYYNSTVHIHALEPTLPFEHTFNPGLPIFNYTIHKSVAFSPDSELLVLEHDFSYPLVVLNLTDYSVKYSLNITTYTYIA